MACFECVHGHMARTDKFVVLVEGVVLQWRYNAQLSNYKFYKLPCARNPSNIKRNAFHATN